MKNPTMPESAPTRIAMWSGPRNLSTAMMRSWENRSDCDVIDEPLYAWYLEETGLDHPGADEIIAAGPSNLGDAIGACLAAPEAAGATISYQKHMAGHLLPGVDRGWLDDLTNCLLLRDPVRVLASYTKVREEVTLLDIGLPQQVELAERAVVIIDSADFLTDPEGYTRLVCDRVGVEFDPVMLSWPAGTRASDGIWAKHWYGAVETSTAFGPPPSDLSPKLPDHLAAIAEEATEIYRELRALCTTL